MALKFPWSKANQNEKTPRIVEKSSKSLLIEAGLILKKRREEFSISRIELAKRTRITTSVLEAIENGWSEKLPEEAYLYSMITILENELNLKKNTLNGIILVNKKNPNRKSLITFTPGSIDIFRTWHGSLIYITLMLGSIFSLNYQTKYLYQENLETFKPILPKSSTMIIGQEDALGNNSFVAKNQLSNYDISTHNNWLISLLSNLKRNKRIGLLELNLSQNSELSITSGNGHQANMSNVKDNLKLKLFSPVIVKINPPPTTNDLIIWKGENYLIGNPDDGVYKFDDLLN